MQPPERPTLRFHGNWLGAASPFLLFVAGVIVLALLGAPSEKGFWPVLMAALAAGLTLARDRRAYCESALEGMARPMTMIMAMAWMLASILGVLMQRAGFIESLLWLAQRGHLGGRGYVAATFLICCLVSASTGTSLGTILLCGPLVYPSGLLLGAPAAPLAGAILAGATFGDSISPISDTTIASALTQRADIGGTVRSRLKYALPCAAAALLLFLVTSTPTTPAEGAANAPAADPGALAMGLVPLLVLGLLFRGRHLLEGLLWGVLAGTILALSLGLIPAATLLALDPQAFTATSFIIDGIERSVGIIVFTILLLGLVGTLESSGLVESVVRRLEPMAHSARRAEAAIAGAAGVAVLLTTHSIVAILMVGEFARRSGEAQNIHRYRRANLLDLTVVTFPFLLPYCIPVILAAGVASSGAAYGVSPVSALRVGFFNFYSWAVLGVVGLAITTGWGRTRG